MDGLPVSVLIVDDHEVVRRGVRAYLETVPDVRVVGEASSGDQAVVMSETCAPDVVLMDLILPGMDGLEATRQIKEHNPRTQVVVLTSYDQDEYIFPALQAGATSYTLKDMKMDHLADAIRKAARGESTLHPRVAMRVVKSVRGEINGEAQLNCMTGRELEVLKMVAHGLSNNQIAEALVLSEYTVKGHVSNILSKLGLTDRTQAAVYAWQQGIVRREAGDLPSLA
jgi:NarL family two-component system response regulator LiaR